MNKKYETVLLLLFVYLLSLLALFAGSAVLVVAVVFVSCGVFSVNQLLIKWVLINCERYHHMQMMSSLRISYLIIQQIVTLPIYGKEALNICHPYMTPILRYT